MRRSKWIVSLTLALALMASPVTLAFYDIVRDDLDTNAGTGVAIVHVTGNIYATVYYIDTNGDGEYSEGDYRIRMVLFRV